MAPGRPGIYPTGKKLKKCPFTWLEKECSSDCALFVEDIRAYDNGPEKIVKGCVFVLDHEEHRSSQSRLAAIQKETGEVKNNIIYQALALMQNEQGVRELLKSAKRNLQLEHKPDGGV